MQVRTISTNTDACRVHACRWIQILLVILFFVFTPVASGGVDGPVRPSKKDKCPVCGMFVHKYPDWLAEIVFKDGSAVFFDGAKDMFTYLFDIPKFGSGKRRQEVHAIYVTEWYRVELIDATKAFYVIGSDVYGPMGRELIAFHDRKDADIFLKDHQGNLILTFERVTPAVIGRLNN